MNFIVWPNSCMSEIWTADRYWHVTYFSEKGIRRGTTWTIKNYPERYDLCINNFDPQKCYPFAMYLYFNNQHESALYDPIPYGKFQWFEDTSTTVNNFAKNYNKNSQTRYT